MKIEIGESIIYSWLRHVKKCQVAQMNWKASPCWDEDFNIEELQSIMDSANIKFDEPFKKTKNIEQLIKQAEIDGIGINLKTNSIYAVDIAFHENGLNYGGKSKTVERVTKKILRTVFAVKLYFSKFDHAEILFISPKINPSILSPLKEQILNIEEFIKSNDLSVNIKIISNDEFNENVICPIKILSSSISDTAELFLRSYQLINMFENERNSKGNNDSRNSSEPSLTSPNKTNEEIKKVERKIPKWFRDKHQVNSQILYAFLYLEFEGVVLLENLRDKCDKCKEIKDFDGNYNQMKNFGDKNHAKVFEEEEGRIKLWEPVKHFIYEEYNKQKNA